MRIHRARDVASNVSRPFEEQRGKRSVAIDMRHPDGPAAVLGDGRHRGGLPGGLNRPGITEKMGIGRAQASSEILDLVYGRATGWGAPARTHSWRATTSTT